jgi:hypothetical protein
MIDSLLISAALSLVPMKDSSVTVRPFYAPAPKAPIVVAVASVQSPESLTTCYENRNGCWSE